MAGIHESLIMDREPPHLSLRFYVITQTSRG